MGSAGMLAAVTVLSAGIVADAVDAAAGDDGWPACRAAGDAAQPVSISRTIPAEKSRIERWFITPNPIPCNKTDARPSTDGDTDTRMIATWRQRQWLRIRESVSIPEF